MPICLLKIFNGSIDVVSLDGVVKDGLSDLIPNMLANIDLNDIFKNIKLA